MANSGVKKESFDEDRVRCVLNILIRRNGADAETASQFQRDLDLIVLEVRARVLGVNQNKKNFLMNAISNVMDGWFNNYARKRLFKKYEECMDRQGFTACPFDRFRVTRGRDETLTSSAMRFENLLNIGINVGSTVKNADICDPERVRVVAKITPEVFLVFEDEPLSEYNNAHLITPVNSK